MHDKTIRLTKHAYERYCERVVPIGWRELERQLQDHQYGGIYHKQGYVLIGGIWWRGTVKDTEIVLHTCYGEQHLDVPAAVRWAKRHGDRIVLGGEGMMSP